MSISLANKALYCALYKCELVLGVDKEGVTDLDRTVRWTKMAWLRHLLHLVDFVICMDLDTIFRTDTNVLEFVDPAADISFTLPREGTVYEWYAPGEAMPVLSVQTFIDIPAIWQYKPGETDAVAESAPVDWKLGPSPLQLGAPLHCPGLAGRDLLVTDAMGRTLFRGQPAVTGTLATLDTKGWTNGMVVVTDLNSGRSARVVIR